MPTKETVLSNIIESKVVAVVRLDDAKDLDPTVDALLEGGIRLIEATMTIPGLLDVASKVIDRVGGDMVFGIGSVLNADMARRVIDAGAMFVVSPVMKQEIIAEAKAADRAVSVGAYTPTEIQTAWEAGSDIVKVFPAETLGPSFIKGVRAPMPHLKLMPTGGVSAGNVHEWLNAGAVALGVGGALVDIKAVRERRFDIIRSNAATLRKAVDDALGLTR